MITASDMMNLADDLSENQREEDIEERIQSLYEIAEFLIKPDEWHDEV